MEASVAIPESTLQQWASKVPPGQSAHTYEVVRRALDQHVWPPGMRHDVYLQGSYRNDTNIRRDSDVDVVTELASSFIYDDSSVPQAGRIRLRQDIRPAAHTLEEFYGECLAALRATFGAAQVSPGNKAVRLEPSGGRLPADILVCQTHREYRPNLAWNEGITFQTRRDRRWIVNYPRQHHDNGVAKSGNTSGRFKAAVRMIKRARNELPASSGYGAAAAPSYFVECLLYNAPSRCFGGNYTDTFIALVNWILNTRLEGLLCQNGLQPLFGSSPEQWSVQAATGFAQGLADLWNTWN